MKIVQFSGPPTPLVHLSPTFFHPLNLGPPISNEPPSPNDNQSTKRKHNPKMNIIMLLGPSFRSLFVFSINSLILPSFPSTSFHLAEASLICFFVVLYFCVCSCHLCAIIHTFSTLSYLIVRGVE